MEGRDRTSNEAGGARRSLRRFAAAVGATRRRRAGAVTVVALAGLLFGVAPVIGDGLNQTATPNRPVVPGTVAATSAQVAGQVATSSARVAAAGNGAEQAKSKGKRSRPKLRRLTFESRVTDEPIVTEENKGSFVGVKCPKGSKAISGGVLNKYINLVVSSSAPNNPISGKYTPRTWWLTVTNANVDGQGGSLPWHGIVNCLKPVRLQK